MYTYIILTTYTTLYTTYTCTTYNNLQYNYTNQNTVGLLTMLYLMFIH